MAGADQRRVCIDYIYSAHSAYAYLGAPRLYEICAAHHVVLRHKPILLSPVVEAAGGVPFADRTQPHVDYYFGRELERWSQWRDVPIVNFRPTHHDNPLELPNGVIIAAQEQGADVNAVSFAILQAHWRDDADIADAGVVEACLANAGLEAQPLLDAALSAEVQAIHAANTQAAIQSSVFGSPTYVVDGDPFYGQDRLELVERAVNAPFRELGFVNPQVD